VVLRQGVEAPYSGYLVGGEETPSISIAGGAEATGWQVFAAYIPVGFDHNLSKCLDHILFVLGIYLIQAPKCAP